MLVCPRFVNFVICNKLLKFAHRHIFVQFLTKQQTVSPNHATKIKAHKFDTKKHIETWSKSDIPCECAKYCYSIKQNKNKNKNKK